MNRPVSRVLSLLALLTAAGCEPLPDDPIYAYGQALHADGAPLAGVTLPVTRALDTNGSNTDSEGRPLAPEFSDYSTTTTAADGTFIAQALVGDIQEEGEGTYRFRMVTPLEEGRATILSYVLMMGSDVELPPLRPWAANLAWVDADGGPTLTFSPPPPPAELPPAAHYLSLIAEDGSLVPQVTPNPRPVLQLLSEGAPLWQQVDAHSPWTLHPWLLEDFARPEIQVRAMTAGVWSFQPLASNNGFLEFRLEWRSERLPAPSGALLPLSRGATCQPVTEGPCPWTDGKLTQLRVRDGESGATQVVITLPVSSPLSRAVIRALNVSHFSPEAYSLRLEGSEDGVTWSPLVEAVTLPGEDMTSFYYSGSFWVADNPFDGPLVMDGHSLFLDIPLQASTPVRHVRLTAQDSRGRLLPLYQLAELSLFK
ncbi:hypothetical protein [Vitiosangium sp. GDMCC 1.1324]|uniref:hypothetical protein n=1 Tax=Vitiosangium sp. (strain GDMCC 1.1324) TaxID=2138576 RepID=UPI000D3DBEFA|nr:hypothetical protein [Vitiosangium sp. GDMCC 1.1324]PTL81658.1 hypothetical protein DAT35_22185 [Vitiosangium sp. GDMCC 1.1324]